MTLHELSAWEHIDRIESMVYDVIYSDRRPPDPSQVPTSSQRIPSSAVGGSASLGESSRVQEKSQSPKRGGLSFVDGH